ncbi:MAG: hypothetical protein JSV06_03685 [Myxococcales bacterium]|nr:MAG: hypothetical protein JSV06_03685 [Myxococcales bacterium]
MRTRGPGIAKADTRPGDALSRNLVLNVLEDLDALISEETESGATAFAWGDEAQGGAGLIQSRAGRDHEGLRISWNDGQIESIEIESRPGMSFFASGRAANPADVVDAIVPMLWKHIRSGGELPAGIDRFAGALSLP